MREYQEAIAIAVAFGAGITAGLSFAWSDRDPEEQWCGCDGEGMPHLPGTKGFLCGESVI